MGPTSDTRRLDRIVQFDEQSRSFPIRTLVADKKPRSYTWAIRTTLDQGTEGACVGFSWAHELASRPVIIDGIKERDGLAIYQEARTLDEWPGEDYDGTSVLAGAKAVIATGYMKEYRWGFGLQDLILAVGYAGPGVLGTNWYEGMFEPDAKGFIHPTGRLVGGHAILIRGVNVTKKYVTLHNSWGSDWGKNGDCYLSFDDLDKLLHEQGEFCIPVGRKNPL